MRPLAMENVSSKSFGGRQGLWEAEGRLTLPLDLLQIVGVTGRKLQGWSGKTSVIPTPRFTHLADELTLTCYWYLHDLQPCMLIFFSQKCVKRSQISSKMGIGLAENCKIGVDV